MLASRIQGRWCLSFFSLSLMCPHRHQHTCARAHTHTHTHSHAHTHKDEINTSSLCLGGATVDPQILPVLESCRGESVFILGTSFLSGTNSTHHSDRV